MKDRSLSSALHLLLVLAYRHPEVLSSEMLALSMQTNPGVVRRILSKLAKANLVETHRGQGGGSRLAKSLSEITVREVYAALGDEPIFSSFEKKPFKICPVSCGIQGSLNLLYERLEENIYINMAGVKLSELLQNMK